MTEDDGYKTRAEKILKYFATKVSGFPYAMPAMMSAAFWSLNSPLQIVFAGNDTSVALKQSANEKYMPVCVKMLASEAIGEFAKSLSEVNGKPTAYVCHNFSCELPVTKVTDLERLLSPSTD